MLIPLLLACTGERMLDGDECVESEAPVESTTPPVTEAEALSTLESQFMPVGVVWTDGITLSGETSTIEISLSRTSDLATVVTRERGDLDFPPCRHGPELRLPVRLDVDISAGMATSAGLGAIDAAGATLSEMYLWYYQVEAALAEEWDGSARDHMSSTFSADDPVWKMSLYGALSEVAVSIDGFEQDDTRNLAANLWFGALQVDSGDATDDTAGDTGASSGE